MRKELGKFFIDVAKLILAGVVIAAVMRDMYDRLLVSIIGTMAVVIFLISGLILLKEREVRK